MHLLFNEVIVPEQEGNAPYGGDADEHIAQSQYIVLRPDQLDNNALIEKLENAPAYDRPKDFRDNFEGGEKRKEEPTSNRRSIKF